MESLLKMLELWYYKAVLGTMLILFAPVEVSILTIFVMILLDTITGMACALKMKRFNSRTFKKNFKKLLIYCTCILTIRLVEIGALSKFNIIFLTQFTAGFLIITEAISIFENLVILGLPIPDNFLNILFKQFRIRILDEVLYKNKNPEMHEIEDILYFQISSIKSGNLRKLLQITFEQYIDIGNKIIGYFNSIKKSDNELIYYKVLSIIKFGFEETENSWREENVPKEVIAKYNEKVKSKTDEWLIEVKEICYRIISPNKKKDELIKKLTILIYRIVFEVQKNGWNKNKF